MGDNPDTKQMSYLAAKTIVEAAGLRKKEAQERLRPSTLYQPRVYKDGDQWCALLGDDIQTGVCAFGATPEEAYFNWDCVWKKGDA